MNRFVCTLLTATALALPMAAHAFDDAAVDFAGAVSNPRAQMPKVCDDVKLDDTQKTQIHDAYYAFAKQKNTLAAEVKNAALDVRHTYMSATSTKDDATAANTALKTALNNLGDAVGAFSANVFFDILKPEQRAPAWMCIEAMKKAKSKAHRPEKPSHGGK